MFAYTLGSIGMNGSPNNVENVGTGSVIPLSVPASFAVKNLLTMMKTLL